MSTFNPEPDDVEPAEANTDVEDAENVEQDEPVDDE